MTSLVRAPARDEALTAPITAALRLRAPQAADEFIEPVKLYGTSQRLRTRSRNLSSNMSMQDARTLGDAHLVAAIVTTQDLDTKDGLERALQAYSSLDDWNLCKFTSLFPEQISRLGKARLAHADWYAEFTTRPAQLSGGALLTVTISDEQRLAWIGAHGNPARWITGAGETAAPPSLVEAAEIRELLTEAPGVLRQEAIQKVASEMAAAESFDPAIGIALAYNRAVTVFGQQEFDLALRTALLATLEEEERPFLPWIFSRTGWLALIARVLPEPDRRRMLDGLAEDIKSLQPYPEVTGEQFAGETYAALTESFGADEVDAAYLRAGINLRINES